jgi:hypothetical protein
LLFVPIIIINNGHRYFNIWNNQSRAALVENNGAICRGRGKDPEQEDMHELLREEPAQGHQVQAVRLQGPQAEIPRAEDSLIP